MKNLLVGLLALASVSSFASTECSVFIKADSRTIAYLDTKDISVDSCQKHGEDALAWYNESGERKFYGFRRVISKHSVKTDKRDIETVLVIKD